MFKFVVLTLALSSVYGYGGRRAFRGLAAPLALAGGYDAPLGFAGGFDAPLGLAGGYDAPLALAGGYGARSFGPVTAAVQSTRSYEMVPVPVSYEAPIPQTIDIPPNFQPVNMIFRTASSPLNVQQLHTPAAPQYESTRSEDAPSVLTHESYKPVIQEYREVIQPFRKIEQRIEPVVEHVHTVVAKGENYGGYGGYGGAAFAAPIKALAAPLGLSRGY